MAIIENQIGDNAYQGRDAVLVQGVAIAIGRVLAKGVTGFLDWQDRARERQQLLELSDTALKDFGANRAVAWRESEHGGRQD